PDKDRRVCSIRGRFPHKDRRVYSIRVIFPTRLEGGHGGEIFKIAVACAAILKGFTPEKLKMFIDFYHWIHVIAVETMNMRLPDLIVGVVMLAYGLFMRMSNI